MKGDGDLPNKGITNIKYLAAAATGATAPKFSETLTLFQPGGQILPHHCRGRTKNFPVVTSMINR